MYTSHRDLPILVTSAYNIMCIAVFHTQYSPSLLVDQEDLHFPVHHVLPIETVDTTMIVVKGDKTTSLECTHSSSLCARLPDRPCQTFPTLQKTTKPFVKNSTPLSVDGN